ncbi:MAG: CHC2 zinc finger domain-containing protein [Candidatus Pacebacteria bacterium]|nr:CHC2 zinc finger domain-containing protein [Candidatus Paceibacterota bacterium]
MSKTPYVDFKAIKTAISMEQVLTHYGILDKFKRGTDSLSGPCPIHRGSNPTQFRISISKNIWNCFSECKHGGNVLDFIAEMEDVSIHAAALKAIEWFNLDPEAMSADHDESGTDEATPTSKPAPRPATRTATSPAPAEKAEPNTPLKFRLDKLDRKHPYLVERGLSEETIIDFGIGFCSKGMMTGRIVIPIHNPKGEVVAYAGRFPGEPPDKDTEKYKLPPGFKKSQELFNIDRAFREPADKPLLIVEGFFDCMKIHDHGYKKVVALMGSSMSSVQEEMIRHYVKRDSHIIIMLDENEAGITGREDIVVRLSKFCYVRVHQFERPDMEPEHLTDDELADIVEGLK